MIPLLKFKALFSEPKNNDKAVIYSQPYLLEERNAKIMDTQQDIKKMQYIKNACCFIFILQIINIIIILQHKICAFATPYPLGLLLLCLLLKKRTGFDIFKGCFNKQVSISKLLRGFMFSFFPYLISWFFELLYLRMNNYKKMGINPRTPDMYFFGKDHPETVIMSIAFFVAYFIFVFTSEVLFRGYVLRQFTKKYRSKKANIIQSFIYVVFSAPTVIFYALDREYGDAEIMMKLLLIVCIVFNGLLASIKWGAFYYADGSVCMSIADHFCGGFLLCSVFACVETVNVKLLFAQVLIFQFVSCLLSYFYVKTMQKKQKKYIKKIKMIKELKRGQEEDISITLNLPKKTDTINVETEKDEKLDEIAEIIKKT